MKPSIALLSTNLARGGAETQVVRLAIGLRARGYSVSVISLLPPSAFESELLEAGVPLHSLEMRPGKLDVRGLARLALILQRERPRILHCHMFHGNLLGRIVRLMCPVPVVISTVHSIIESSRASGDSRWRDRLYRFTDPLSDLTVAVCRAAAERYAAIKAAPRAKLRVIPNGVDTSVFRPDAARRQALRAELGVAAGEFVWLAVGRLMWKKDYATLIRAFAALRASADVPQPLLLIAGAGEQEAELRTLASELAANVRFLGLREDVAALMQAADASVLSSVVEGLPMVLLEAAASGLPAVSTDVGGADEAVLEGRTGFLAPPSDAGALHAAMARLMALPLAGREAMGRAARDHALANFDLPVILSQWEAVYEALLRKALPSSEASTSRQSRAADSPG